MRTIKHIAAHPLPTIRLTAADLRIEAKKTRPRMLMRAWHLYFTGADGEEIRGRAEALQIESRIGIAWAGDTAWGDLVLAGDEPDWLRLKTDKGVPIIAGLVAPEPADGA